MIPVFPVNMIIFPNSIHPIHVFEERYKKLIKRCLDKNESFVIAPVINEITSKVACEVSIFSIMKTYPNGNMDIALKGTRRVFLENFNDHPDGYKEAKISAYSDYSVKKDLTELREEVLLFFGKVMALAQIKLSENYWNALEKTDLKSFKIAEKAGMTLEQQHDLLFLRSEYERLEYLEDYLKTAEEAIKENLFINRLALNDGFWD